MQGKTESIRHCFKMNKTLWERIFGCGRTTGMIL